MNEGKQIEETDVRQRRGLADKSKIISLFKEVLIGNEKDALKFLHELINDGLDAKNFLNDIDECIESLEEPYAGGFPSWPLFREVKKERKVIIVGTGGDALFDNYGKWKRLFLVNKFKKINLELFKKYYFDLFYYCSDEEKKTIFSFNIEKHQPTSNYLYDIYSNSDFSNPIDQVANLDFKTQLPYEFLFMTDKFSIEHRFDALPVYLDNNLK